MYERIIEIIAYLMSQLQATRSFDEINFDELSDKGYTTTEISTAFSWLIDRMEFSDQVIGNDEIAQSDSFRILNERESAIMTKEAFGYLLQMQQLGLITNEHVEMVLDRSSQTGEQSISDSEMKSIIASVIFNADAAGPAGSRMLLNGTDTIH